MPQGGKTSSYLDFGILLILLAVFVVHFFNLIPSGADDPAVAAVAYLTTLPIIWSALTALKARKISVDLLASIALTVSLMNKEWTSVLFINLMITSARIFGDFTKDRSRRAIESLLKLKPQKAKIKIDGGFKEIPLEEVKRGDLVVAELGDKIPIDGVVEKGEAEVNQMSLTGESLPVPKKTGDKVLSSSIIDSGNLLIRADKIGKETMFERIIELVEKSQINKAPINTISDRFSVWYIAAVTVGSIVLYALSHNTALVLSVLLVSCADDIAVALPLAFLASITHGARHGAIIKGGDYLEALTRANVAIFDKTGTLTFGKLKVINLFTFNNKSKLEVLKIAGTISLMSSHPAARAIKRYIDEKNISINEPEKFEEYSGKGAKAVYKNNVISSGRVSFFMNSDIKLTDRQLEEINAEKDKGFSTFLIGFNGEIAGFFTFADQVRPDAKETIAELRNLGIGKIVMLTGDNRAIAQRVAEETGIEEFHANLLPEDKVIHLKKYLNKKYKTIMIGDGVNDAATLALADIGIAMGAIGSDAAIESADIALMKDNLKQIPELIKISRATLNVVRQNLWLWGIINAVGLILVFEEVLNPTGAAAYNFITDFVPLLNSLRLFR